MTARRGVASFGAVVWGMSLAPRGGVVFLGSNCRGGAPRPAGGSHSLFQTVPVPQHHPVAICQPGSLAREETVCDHHCLVAGVVAFRCDGLLDSLYSDFPAMPFGLNDDPAPLAPGHK